MLKNIICFCFAAALAAEVSPGREYRQGPFTVLVLRFDPRSMLLVGIPFAPTDGDHVQVWAQTDTPTDAVRITVHYGKQNQSAIATPDARGNAGVGFVLPKSERIDSVKVEALITTTKEIIE